MTAPWRVVLLGRFEIVAAGRSIALADGAQRLVTFLALHEGPVARATVVGSLWRVAPSARGHGNLRSAVWRLGQVADGLVAASENHLALQENVTVDVRSSARALRRLLDDPDLDRADEAMQAAACAPLLPGWNEDWVVFPRERMLQLQLHVLEVFAERLLAAGRHADAVRLGAKAAEIGPLRESAEAVVIDSLVEQRRAAEALARYAALRARLHDELGLVPSSRLRRLAAAAARRDAGRVTRR